MLNAESSGNREERPCPCQCIVSDLVSLFACNEDHDLIVIAQFDGARIEPAVAVDRNRRCHSGVVQEQEEFLKIMGAPENDLPYGQYRFQRFFHGLLSMEQMGAGSAS